MKKIIAALILTLAVCVSASAQTPYVLTFNDANVTVPTPHRVGVNLASLNYYDNGQIYKNLVGEDNYGFENTRLQQIWALTSTGTTTTFCNTNQYAVYPANFWTGAAVNGMEGVTKGYSGVVVGNTAGVGGTTPACYTVSPAAPAAFAIGDTVIINQNQFPTPESCWESNTACSIWSNHTNGGKLLTDSTTPYTGDGGKQSLILDVTSNINALATVNLYFDSDAQNRFVVLNGTYQISLQAKANGANHTLGVALLGIPGCSGSLTVTSTWTPYTINCTLTETNNSTRSVSPNIQIAAVGSSGLGQLEIDHVVFQKISGQDSTNTTVFRDEFVAALRDQCATIVSGPGCPIRNWTNQNGETMTNWTARDGGSQMTIASAGAVTYGNITPSLQDYLSLVALVGGIPYLEEPVTFQGADPANLVEYLSSTNTSSGYGLVRASQGQVAPWVGPGGVFSDIYVTFCNECWNNSSFSGQALPWRSTSANDYYHDYWNRAKDVYAAMRSDAYFSSHIHLGFDMQLGVAFAPGGLDTALRGMGAVGGAPDYVEQAPYQQGTISNWQNDGALWGAALQEPWGDVTNSSYFNAVKAIQGYNLCGASGTLPCVATDYEQANSTLSSCGIAGNPACTGGNNTLINQASQDAITAGAGEGVIAPLQGALNQQVLGVTIQNYFGATEYGNNTLHGTTAKLWGDVIDYGGATSYLNNELYSPRPQFMGLSILNHSIIGPEYQATIASQPTYNWSGDVYNGPSLAEANTPYLFPFCYLNTNTAKRSCVFFNTSLTTPYTITFAGTNTPSGTCTQSQFAPSSPDLLNEASTPTPTNTTPATTSIVKSSGACPASLVLPPDSDTSITWSVGSPAAATPTVSVTPGTYTGAQTVALASTTAGATIYYTLDGSAPTTSSSVYTVPLTVAATETINALASASGFANSPVASALYTITPASLTCTATGSMSATGNGITVTVTSH